MTLFSKIIKGEIPATIIYQDDLCIAIRDIAPKARVHILVIPRREIRSMNEAVASDQALLGHLLLTAAQIARSEGIAEDGYRLVFNTNGDGGQTVFHLHLHILGGEPLGGMA